MASRTELRDTRRVGILLKYSAAMLPAAGACSNGSAPTQPSAPTIVRLSGSGAVTFGGLYQTNQLASIADYSDGSVKNVIRPGRHVGEWYTEVFFNDVTQHRGARVHDLHSDQRYSAEFRREVDELDGWRVAGDSGAHRP